MTKKYQQLKALGSGGEAAVAAWLADQGFKILAQNYLVRSGEVDVIAQKGDVIAFVEVKTRNTQYFSLSQLITKSKQQKIGRAARHFALENKLFSHVLRFDIATVLHSNGAFSIEYIENAFVPN
jgi:putative endonuclease